MTTTYRQAAELLWGEAGTVMHDAYDELLPLYDNLPPALPMVIGITAYGHCIGLTRQETVLDSPRISIGSNTFNRGHRFVADIVAHEMLHVSLGIAGRNVNHAGPDWYAELRRLAPSLLGHDIDISLGSGRRSVRVPNPDFVEGSDKPKTVVRKEKVAVEHPHKKVAGFPQSFRPDDYDYGRPVSVPTY